MISTPIFVVLGAPSDPDAGLAVRSRQIQTGRDVPAHGAACKVWSSTPRPDPHVSRLDTQGQRAFNDRLDRRASPVPAFPILTGAARPHLDRHQLSRILLPRFGGSAAAPAAHAGDRKSKRQPHSGIGAGFDRRIWFLDKLQRIVSLTAGDCGGRRRDLAPRHSSSKLHGRRYPNRCRGCRRAFT
jgi:hypothetical protein